MDTRLILAQLFPLHFEEAISERIDNSAARSLDEKISASPGAGDGGPESSQASSPAIQAVPGVVTAQH